MLRRTRTAKKLAQRHDRTYFTRWNKMARWGVILSLALPAMAAVWVTWHTFGGRQAMYSSGPLSASHALFAKQCSVCHATTIGFFRRHVTSQTCQSCHDGPAHNAKQAFTPECSACHTEHIGAARLAAVADQACTGCHAKITTRGIQRASVFDVSNFASAHPEFAALRDPGGDRANLRFNHRVHLKEKLAGPRGPIKLECSDCHRPASRAAGAWPYGRTPPTAGGEAVATTQERLHGSDPLMAPVSYERHCAACHNLQFDKQVPGEVPHATPAVVRSYLQKAIREYVRSHPAVLRPPVGAVSLLPGRLSGASTRLPATIEERIVEDEQLLWKKTCLQCHTIRPGADLPQVVATAVPQRWFKKAIFDHQAHSIIECASCHSRAGASVETSDVLVPGINSCRTCHNGQSQVAQAAESRCFECHRYHDWSKAKPTKGRFKIPELISMRSAQRPEMATWP